MFLILSLLLFYVKAQLYDPLLYSPGTNLIVNPTFSDPDIGGSLHLYIPGSILGWMTVACQIFTISQACGIISQTYTYNHTQALDLDENFSFEMISQSVSISSSNQYLLSVGWLEPIVSPIGKSFEILVNTTSLANITVATSYSYVEQLSQFSSSMEIQDSLILALFKREGHLTHMEFYLPLCFYKN